MPMVPELLLQLRDGLFQRHDLLCPLLILMQPVRDLVCAAKHIGASTLIQLRQCGHQATHPILHHLSSTGSDSRNNRMCERTMPLSLFICFCQCSYT